MADITSDRRLASASRAVMGAFESKTALTTTTTTTTTSLRTIPSGTTTQSRTVTLTSPILAPNPTGTTTGEPHLTTSVARSSVESSAPTTFPGAPTARDFSGPWFRTSLILSVSLGIASVILFSILRTRWKKVYAARALVKQREFEEKIRKEQRLQNGESTEDEGEEDADGDEENYGTPSERNKRATAANIDEDGRREVEATRNVWSDTVSRTMPSLEPGNVSGNWDPALDITLDHPGFLGWILPSWRVPDSTLLATIGLEAVVFLDFLRTCFRFFSICAIAAIIVLIPVNLTRHGSTDSDEPEEPDRDNSTSFLGIPRQDRLPTRALSWQLLVDGGVIGDPSAPIPSPGQGVPSGDGRQPWGSVIANVETNNTLHLLFTYFFSLLALWMLHKSFHRFLSFRQVYAIARKSTVPARTVLVSEIPFELRGEHELKEYFEQECGFKVDQHEGVKIVRDIGKELKDALKQREEALKGLEAAWWKYQQQGSDTKSPPAKGKIRLEGQEGGLSNPTTSTAEATGTSDETPRDWPSARPPAPFNGVTDDEAGWGSSARWEEARRASADLPSAPGDENTHRGQEDAAAVSENAHYDSDRPTKHVPATKLQKALPFLGQPVDALDHWQDRFEAADARVQVLRHKHGGHRRRQQQDMGEQATEHDSIVEGHEDPEAGHRDWKASADAFVTFETISDAELAAQVVHFPRHSQCRTSLAPTPDDVIWGNLGMSSRERLVRNVLGQAVTLFGLLFWVAPVAAVASLLSFEEIKKVAPWLANLIERSELAKALVQTTLPSTAIIVFNAALPYLLEWLCYTQGFRSRSEIYDSLLRKYTLFLLVSVLFVFLLVSTFWALFLDLADSPQKIPQKLAQALTRYNARAFSMSYVMLQGVGIMPFQLMNFGTVALIGLNKLLFTLSPRETENLYSPTNVNYGMVYPPAILVFILTLVYSVLSPLILIFGAIYFAFAYTVYRYKLINVFASPVSSLTAHHFPTTFARLIWGLSIFQLFMTGLFAARQSVFASTGMIPLLIGTVVWSWVMRRDLQGLAGHTPLAFIARDRDTNHRSGSNSPADNAASPGRYDGDDGVQSRGEARSDSSKMTVKAAGETYCQPELSQVLPTPMIPPRILRQQRRRRERQNGSDHGVGNELQDGLQGSRNMSNGQNGNVDEDTQERDVWARS